MPSSEQPDVDADIALLAQEYGLSLTKEQRTYLPKELKDIQNVIASLRKFDLQDGDSEPATVLPIFPK